MTARVPSLSSLLLARRSGPPGSNAAPDERADAVAALRVELEAQTNPLERARLLHEVGGFEQARGSLARAAQDFVEATNLDPAALGPLRALIALALRRESAKNLGPLLERLALVASTAEEKQLAYLLLAELQLESQEPAEALHTVERWLDDFPDDASAWLALDVLASSRGDETLRERARTGRAAVTAEGWWRALLLLECADLRARSGDADTALALCRQAADEHPDISVWRAWERMACKLERWSEASAVAEHTAARVTEIAGEDAGEDAGNVGGGVGAEAERPWYASPSVASSFLLRGAEWARRAGDETRSRALLDRLSSAEPDELLPRLARLELARSGSDGARRKELIQDALRVVPEGPIAAAMWLDLAALAAQASDGPGEERALRAALANDPEGPLPLARSLDQLETAARGTAYAAALASVTDRVGSRRADWLLSAALVSAVGDPATAPRPERSREVERHLASAREAGADRRLVAQLRALLMHLLGDGTSYEAAVRELVDSAGVSSAEGCIELLRSHWAHGPAESARIAAPSTDGARDALSTALELWMPHAFGVERSAVASQAWRDALVAEGADRDLVQAAELLTVRRLLEAGDTERAVQRLRDRLREHPEETPVAAVLSALLATSDPVDAARVLADCARLQQDVTLRGGWLLRASRFLWQARKPEDALGLAREAALDVPGAAQPWLTWGARLVAPDDPSARERLLLELEDDRGVHCALERSTLALTGSASGSRSPEKVEARFAEEPNLRWLSALNDAAEAGSTLSPQALDRALDGLPGAPAGLGPALMHGALLHGALARHRRGGSSPTPGADDPAVDGAALDSAVLDSASQWARAASSDTDGIDSALAWLVASRAAKNAFHEVEARALLAERLGAPELQTGAALLAWLTRAPRAEELARGLRERVEAAEHDPSGALCARWAALEFTPPGTPSLERGRALEGLATSLADRATEAGGDPGSTGTLLVLAGFNHLHAQRFAEASAAFRRATDLLPDDCAGWEGLRSVAQQTGDARLEAEACTELARRTSDNASAAALWERAGVLHQDLLGDSASAEEALRAALGRDFLRETAFQRLYLLARQRGDEERLLELVEGRLGVVEDARQFNELLWAKARHCRALREEAAALRTLEQLLEREPEHVGALALMSDLCLRGRHHRRAAGVLARLASHASAPEAQRILSGLASADLYEQRLGELGRALEVLESLERDGLGTEPVLERLAFASLRAERWAIAARCLEQLLEEASSAEARTTAATFLLALYRDQLSAPERAVQVAEQILDFRPSHPDALTFLLEQPVDTDRRPWLERALDDLREEAAVRGLDSTRMALAARLAQELGWQRTALAAHGMLHLQGVLDATSWSELAEWASACPRAPGPEALPWTEYDLAAIASAQDTGPFLDLAREVTRSCPGLELTAEELGLNDGAGEAPAVDSSGTSPHARELERWASTLGLPGLRVREGANPGVLAALSGTPPTLALDHITALDDAASRARATGALYALTRGTAPWFARTEAACARWVAALARAFGQADLETAFGADASQEELDSLARKLTDGLEPDARARLSAALDRAPRDREAFREWYRAGERSMLRMGALALGEPSRLGPLLSDLQANQAREQLLADLEGFLLSTEFVRLRSAVDLEGP